MKQLNYLSDIRTKVELNCDKATKFNIENTKIDTINFSKYQISFLLNSSLLKINSKKKSKFKCIMDSSERFKKINKIDLKKKNFREIFEEKQKLEEDKIKKNIFEKFNQGDLFSKSNKDFEEQINKNKFPNFFQKNMSLSFEINFKFPKLSFTLEKFPDEIDPKLFFLQNQNSYEDFINYLEKYKDISKKLNIYFFNFEHENFFSPFEIKIKNEVSGNFNFFLPISVSYFFRSLSRIVQLCLAYHLLINILEKKIKKNKFLKIDIFLETIKKLMIKDQQNEDILLNKKYKKKISNFHNHKLNVVFSNSQNFSSKNFCKNTSKENSFKDFQNSELNISNKNSKSTNYISSKQKFILNINFKNKKSLKESYLKKSNNKNPLIKNSDSNKENTIDHISNSNSNSNSNSDSNSDSDSKSNSESESDTSSQSSLNEEIYNAVNPYEVAYSKLQDELTFYEIEIIPANIVDQEGRIKFFGLEEFYLYLKE